MEFLLISTVLMGVATAMAAFAGEPYFVRALAFVEDDLRDKLRRLRVNTRSLHKWVIVWAIAIFGCLFGFTVGADSLAFGIVFAILLVCVPWYVVRRMAEKRRLRIEDQLADAMVALSSAIRAGLSRGQALEIRA